jgi:hypothetical protein
MKDSFEKGNGQNSPELLASQVRRPFPTDSQSEETRVFPANNLHCIQVF